MEHVTVLHGKTQGGQAGRARRVRLADTRGYSHATTSATFDQWLKPRQITLRPLLWEVSCDAYTCVKSSYEAAHANKPCFGVRRFKFDSDE